MNENECSQKDDFPLQPTKLRRSTPEDYLNHPLITKKPKEKDEDFEVNSTSINQPIFSDETTPEQHQQEDVPETSWVKTRTRSAAQIRRYDSHGYLCAVVLTRRVSFP